MNHPQSLADGRYLLVKPLGEGGMATVYRAYDQRLQVWRAVKVLNPEFSSKPRLKARFETEAQTMALLEHAHIVRVYDVGRDGEFAYIVMELVEGGSLVDWLEAYGAMPARMAVDVTAQVCDGIASAHAKGVIHRDIKPHNILVTTEGVCRVTDFGIARVGDTKDGMTKTGAVMGTWGYMAPEQRSDAKSVDERADVYATAASLYSLLTNSMPMDLFAADRDASMMEGIPATLIPVLIKATEYHRDDRYPDVESLKAALMEIRDGLAEIPDDTPPLAREASEPPPVPDPADYVGTGLRSARTDPTIVNVENGGGGAQGATLAPAAGVQAESSPTILPSDQSGTLPPPDSTLGNGEVSGQVHPTFTPAAAPPREPRPRKRRVGAILGWMTVLGIAVVGLGLGAVAVGIVVYSSWDGDEPLQVDPETPDEPEDPAVVNGPEEPVAEDTGQPVEAIAIGGKPPPPVTPSEGTSTRPPTLPTTSTTTTTSTPTPDPAPGTDTPPPDVPPEEDPEGTASEQCFDSVGAPDMISLLKGSAVFSAKLCEEDGTEVVLWYRPPGESWSSMKMPLAMGAHRTKVHLDERFAIGMEYYLVAGTASHGGQAEPLFVRGPKTE